MCFLKWIRMWKVAQSEWRDERTKPSHKLHLTVLFTELSGLCRVISREGCTWSMHYQVLNDLELREWDHHCKDDEYRPHLFEETVANFGLHAPPTGWIFGIAKDLQTMDRPSWSPRKVSDKSSKWIQKNGHLVPRGNAGSAKVSIRVKLYKLF